MKPRSEPGYGQVFQTWSEVRGERAWRGILMNTDGKELWLGLAKDSPNKAFADMANAAEKYGITDLREWSGMAF